MYNIIDRQNGTHSVRFSSFQRLVVTQWTDGNNNNNKITKYKNRIKIVKIPCSFGLY